MGHGTPDWWGVGPQEQQHRLNDQAELAVRLDSPNWYDRRGTTILQDSFEHGLGNWHVFGDAFDWLVRLTADGSRTAGYAVELTPGAVDGNGAGIARYVRRPEPGGCGLEVTFAPNTDDLGFVTSEAVVFDGSESRTFGGRYDHQIGEVQVRDDGGNWQTVGSPGSYRAVAQAWITMKLRFDTLAGTYINLLIGPEQYDASDYGPEVIVSSTPDELYVSVEGRVDGDNLIHPFVDNVIVTHNEF